MANQQMGAIDLNFTDSRKASAVYYSGANAGDNPLTNYAETVDIDALRTALSTFDSFTYTAPVLNTMSVNDMVFAWRMCRGNHQSVADYATAQVARVS